MQKQQLFFFILICVSTIFSCTKDDCDVICADGEVLTADCACEVISTGETSEVRIETNINSDQTWSSGKNYIIAGRITVEEGATLTIEPGTVVKGEVGAGANASALLIARGAKLEACGTEAAPIIFTTVADQITSAQVLAGNVLSPNMQTDVSGLWGGLIILGKAPISASNDDGQLNEVQIEGIPVSDTNGLYGGNDAEDNSGSLCYVSIRHGGSNIGGGNEINGLTLGGVGSGTTINQVEVVSNQDDGVEWFGGTVSATNVLVWGCGDDGLDTDQAWNGSCDNWIVAVPAGGSAMELDGPEGNLTQGCNTFINGTIYTGATIDHIIDWDDDTNTGITNLYINATGLEVDYDPSVGVESFGGDLMCNTGMWEYTVADGFDSASMFGGTGAEEVSENANSRGADTSTFGWTLGRASGTLDAIGL